MPKSVKIALLSACALMGATALPAISRADADLVISTAPPAPRTEVMPAPRQGYVWAPGYWKWDNGEHVWVEGRWMEERPHAHWVPDRWTQDPNDPNHWHFREGHWDQG